MKLRVYLLLAAGLLIGCVFMPEPLGAGKKSASEARLTEGCAVEPTARRLPHFARLMHDAQWMDWPSRMANPEWPRGFHFDWYPETVPLWRTPRGGDGRLAYNVEWLEFLRELQPEDEAAVWIARIAAGLFNKGNEFIPILNPAQLTSKPVAESISSGGNVVRILEVKNGSGRIEMLYFNDGPPDLNEVNYHLTPWLITKFTSVSIDGELGNAGGIDVYFPNVAKSRKGYWVNMDRVEWFPRLPVCATVHEETNIWTEPSFSSLVVETLTAGREVVVYEYLPQNSDVWGRTDNGWISLEYQMNGQPIYPTTWAMETRPPIVFD
jgi:hypothetical protein